MTQNEDFQLTALMPYLILLLFALAALLAFWEDKLSRKANRMALIAVGVVLVCMAGLKEIGADPDSLNYAGDYRRCYLGEGDMNREFTFRWLCELFNLITTDPHIIFFFYAGVGLVLKFVCFKHLSGSYFLPLVVYLSFYFEMHEMMQIRTAILSGCLLCAVRPIANGERLKALIILLVGSMFHASGLMLLPLIFLSSQPLSTKWKWLWLGIIPLGYLIYFAGGSILFNANVPFIGPKLAAYQQASEQGLLLIRVNIFAPLILLSALIYVYLMLYADVITARNRYFPLMLKIYGLGICAWVAFAFLPVLAERASFLLRTITIVLYPCLFYTIKPAWAAKSILILLSLLFMNYGLSYLYFTLFWEV